MKLYLCLDCGEDRQNALQVLRLVWEELHHGLVPTDNHKHIEKPTDSLEEDRQMSEDEIEGSIMRSVTLCRRSDGSYCVWISEAASHSSISMIMDPGKNKSMDLLTWILSMARSESASSDEEVACWRRRLDRETTMSSR